VNSEHYKLRTIAEDQVKELKNQLRQANNSSDMEKIKKLDQSIREKQQEIEDLRQQLKDKPIEATASQVVEKIPENIEETFYHLRNYQKVNSSLEIVEGLTTDELRSWAKMMNNRQAVNDYDESCWLEMLTTVIEKLQDMEEDYRQGGA
jgi:DNA-directed RNA polymerase specialized sigma54-like protein